MNNFYLALDQGGHASRAFVFDAGGTVVSTAAITIATRRNDEGHIEHDPEELVMSLQQAIDDACGELPIGSASWPRRPLTFQLVWAPADRRALSPLIPAGPAQRTC